ncbi:uncharacterized protein LOC141907740 [Tubulanus polymorphus]|uniref:uncharacterized protein LOC141907740 n=1 Tax=Tubulanus polymorphus TaxID=672921 RepID=UPI003DA1D710
MPPTDENVLKFVNVTKQHKLPYVIYADFEMFLEPIEGCKLNQNQSWTYRYQVHEPCGFCFKVVGPDTRHSHPTVLYRGDDVMKKFLTSLLEKAEEILQEYKNPQPLVMNDVDETHFKSTDICHICKETINGKKCRDHDHITGKYRGPACNSCNLSYRVPNFIPVIFHNLKSYDSHEIIRSLGLVEFRGYRISVIPTNTEKFIGFTLGPLRFIDSLAFLNTSLSTLTENLVNSGREKFIHLNSEFPANKLDLLLRKGVYPYDYMTGSEKFNETSLPPKEAFTNTLTNTEISVDDYKHAQNIWSQFNMANMGEYHDLYLRTDVLLLSDIFEEFRKFAHKSYGLDPCHYYTLPGYSWDACLKLTKVELQLFTEVDMYLFIEQGIRGGISVITHRYFEANNKYFADYDEAKESSYIMYLDANNLYGWAMSQALPVGEFRWLETENDPLWPDAQDILTMTDDAHFGMILEVDLEYGAELHDLHNDLPLAPERMLVNEDLMLSPYQKLLFQTLKLSSSKIHKLIPNLYNKTRYIVHYRNLRLYMKLGMKLTKIHRVLHFRQSAWMSPYIALNTEFRKNAKSNFEKDMYKLLNNASFGKTMENIRNRINYQIINEPGKLRKALAKPSTISWNIISENVVGVKKQQISIKLDKPVYLGFSILDISKTLMYDFHYNTIKAGYGDNAKLLFTDTDSLTYAIRSNDLYTDMAGISDQFDFSAYPTGHPLFSDKNKKVLGKFKDETNSFPVKVFCGLRSKMYSMTYLSPDNNGTLVEKKTAKGVAKYVVKQSVSHNNYVDCLRNQSRMMANMRSIRSFNHKLHSVNLNKVGLSPYDDKRYILDDGVSTYAYGHHKIPEINHH